MATTETNDRGIWPKSLITIPLIVGIGILMGYLSNSGFSNDWYARLDKPAFQPPGWAFGAVWTTLYTMMGIALSILWRARNDKSAATPAMQLFTIQFILNLAWSFIFFRMENPRGAFFEILVLNVAIVLTIVAAWRVSKVAAVLLIPYLCWTLFATVLNGTIWRMNS